MGLFDLFSSKKVEPEKTKLVKVEVDKKFEMKIDKDNLIKLDVDKENQLPKAPKIITKREREEMERKE